MLSKASNPFFFYKSFAPIAHSSDGGHGACPWHSRPRVRVPGNLNQGEKEAMALVRPMPDGKDCN